MALYRTGINEIASDRNFIEIWDLRDEETGLTTNKVHVADVFVGDYDAVEMADLFVAAPDLLNAAKKLCDFIDAQGSNDPDRVSSGWLAFPEEELEEVYAAMREAIRKAERS